eukprot:GHUV01015054.1.p1 GENE.GHUV01015054.1~~GHUV01015054.1.p1  ORF type:complete len:402 (+),score=87.18 GHUV01015054.1:361-1566(+)
MSAEHKARFFQDYKWTLFSGSCLAVHFGTWVWSLENTSLAHSLLLVSTTPIILVVFALVMRHAISWGEILGAVVAVVGVAVLAGGAAAGKEAEVTLIGDLSALAAAVSVALHWHAGKYLRTYQPVFVYSAPVTAIAAGSLLLTALAFEDHSIVGENRHGIFGWTRSAKYAPFVVYLGAVPGIIGHQGFNTVLKYMPPLMVSLAVQFEPIVGPLIGWAVGVALPPGIFTWIGGAVVLVAAAGATVATAKRQEQEEQQSRGRVGMMKLPTQDLEDYEVDLDTLDLDQSLHQSIDASLGDRDYEMAGLKAPAGEQPVQIDVDSGGKVAKGVGLGVPVQQNGGSQAAADTNSSQLVSSSIGGGGSNGWDSGVQYHEQLSDGFMDVELGPPRRTAICSYADKPADM